MAEYRQKEWYLKNKERLSNLAKERYIKNKEAIDARNARYSLENREKVYEQQRKWREKKRLTKLAKKPKREQLSEFAILMHQVRFGGLREQVIQRDGEKCIDCGMTREEHVEQFGKDLTVDHINGKGRNSKEPENTLENLATRCLPCHGRKDQKRMRKN